MMLRHMGWTEAADLIIASMESVHRQQEGHLRLRAPDGRRHAGVVLGLRPGDDRPHVARAFDNLIPGHTVRENVALVTDIVAHPMSADDAIDRVGLTPRRDHFPAQLSGGEQQRVAIARAIVSLADGTTLIVYPPTNLSDGMRVKARSVS
jgi:ABC-type polar amino acid transport system ATPase subunit